MAEIILSRTCKSIMDYRFDTLVNVLNTKVNAFKYQLRNSAEILKLTRQFLVGIFLLTNYLDDAELELFSIMSLTG